MKDFKDGPLEFYYHAVIEKENLKKLSLDPRGRKPDCYWLTSNKGHLKRFETIEDLKLFCMQYKIHAVLVD